MFGCTPDVAERQNPQMVSRIAEYRAAGRAVALMNEGPKGVQGLSQEPGLMTLLLEMSRAQLDSEVTEEAIFAGMMAREIADEFSG